LRGIGLNAPAQTNPQTTYVCPPKRPVEHLMAVCECMYGTASGTVRGAYRRSRHFPLDSIENRSSFDFAFFRPELINDPRYDTAEARSRNSEEVGSCSMKPSAAETWPSGNRSSAKRAWSWA
jgi:hypothetical protein